MSLRIAFDLDGVLADMRGAFRREAARLGISNDDHSRLWRHIRKIENFWETLDELSSGSVGRLGALAAARRWEVLFVTARPPTAGNTAQCQSQRWLERRGFRVPSVYVVSGSRGKIADALDLDIVVDDRPENCLDVRSESSARAILVWAGDGPVSGKASGLPMTERALGLGIGVVRSVGECLDLLEALHAAPEQQDGSPRRGLVRQLVSRLGLPGAVRRSQPDQMAQPRRSSTEGTR